MTPAPSPPSPSPSPSHDNARRPAGPVLVTGGTGTLGRPLVDRLLADGVPVRVMSRRPRREGDERPCEWAVCDLTKDVGLAEAVSGVRAVVHCATDPWREARVLSRLAEAARQADVAHLVYISIVGVDRIPFPYYKGKYAAERLLETSGLPWTILRATQFHDLVTTLTTVQRRMPVVVAPSGFRFQPVDVTEVAGRLAELVGREPAGRVPDMGGPRVLDAREAAAQVLRATGRSRRVVGLPLPGRTARAFRRGGNLAPDHATGAGTFEEFLANRYGHPGPHDPPESHGR
ncbi:NAD-dependent epimerase/dehydratase family protein [Streptomyces diacarni]|uniref:NAD-dependent epimerase/dehydratase family protein n=1 Tax=Streptomyces diacarni TaxID=2800381 RepID=A0A367EHP2_9ACTN|nr:NAD(P)H-binding protein [Streptomyces diacarni]RCG16877.1 NAD-dependent epimerase/dehydratase family protein [Streptomyces diacarni]